MKVLGTILSISDGKWHDARIFYIPCELWHSWNPVGKSASIMEYMRSEYDT